MGDTHDSTTGTRTRIRSHEVTSSHTRTAPHLLMTAGSDTTDTHTHSLTTTAEASNLGNTVLRLLVARLDASGLVGLTSFFNNQAGSFTVVG